MNVLCMPGYFWLCEKRVRASDITGHDWKDRKLPAEFSNRISRRAFPLAVPASPQISSEMYTVPVLTFPELEHSETKAAL